MLKTGYKKTIFSSLLIAFAVLNTKLVNGEPVLSYSISDQVPPVAYIDKEYTFEIAENTMLSSINSDEDITYKAFLLPSWLSFDGATFTGEPTSSDSSSNDISITLEGYDSSDDSYLNTTFVIDLMTSATVSVSDSFNINSFLSQNGDTTGSNGYIITPGKEFSLQFSSSDFTSSDSVTYGAKMTDGNSPLPIWLDFDTSSLKFSGTSPSVNSEIAAAQNYGITLYATTETGVSMAEIDFSLVVGAHSLSISDSTVSINTTSSSRAFTYTLDMSSVKLDGDSVTSDNISSVSLSSGAPSWASLSSMGDLNYVLSGTVPSDFDSSSESFSIQVYDIYEDEVNFSVNLNYDTSKTSSTSSSTTSSSSSTSSPSTTSSYSTSSTVSSNNSSSTTSAKITTTTLAPSTSSMSSATASTSSSNTSSTFATSGAKNPTHKKNKHVTAIVCGVVIPVVVLLILLLLLLFFLKRRKESKKSTQDSAAGTGGSKPDNSSPLGQPDLEKTAPLVLATTVSQSSSSSDSNSRYEKTHDKSINNINADTLNGIPTAAAAAELDKNLQNFLQDSSQTEGDVADSSNTTNSTSLYSPIRQSQSSLEKQNLYYQSMKNKGKESWRNVTETAGTSQQGIIPISDNFHEDQPKISPRFDQMDQFKKSDKSDNRSSYHTLNSIDTDEFMAMDLKPNSSINIDENSHRKASLLNVRDSVFLTDQDNTVNLDDGIQYRPDLSTTKKSSMLVPFENVDSSVTKGDVTDGQSIETASL